MKIIIHRGTKEIGGTLIEVISGKSRIILDAGLPLVDPADKAKKLDINLRRKTPKQLREMGIQPSVRGLWADLDDGPPVDAVLLSHPHQDHHGLLSYIRPDIPVYLSADTLRILNRSDAFIRPGARVRNAKFLDHRVAKRVENTLFTVTPFTMDHSAYGALAFLLEADDRRLFYTGDFRGHGRKAALFEELCRQPPRAIDRLLIEGTTLGSDSHDDKTEGQLENDLIKAFGQYSGIKFVSVSGQNIDRLVTLYRACKRSRRVLVVDLYTATILQGLKRSSIPHPGPDWQDQGQFRVLFTERYEQILQKHPSYKEVLALSEPFRITQKEIGRDPGRHVVIFREHWMKEYEAIGDWGDAALIYSQWKGYMEEPAFQKTAAELKARGVEILSHLHTSGHASKAQLRKLINALAPKVLTPIHTFHGDIFKELWPRVEPLEDGVLYDV